MNNVIQYNSKDRYVKILLKDGGSFGEVKIYPDKYDPYSRWHNIERKNGVVESVKTKDIKAVLYIHG